MTVNIGLDLPEVREDLLKTPLVVAGRGPAIEVLGYAPVEGRGVDGAGPPVTLPLGTGIGGALAVALATNCQLCLLVNRDIGWPD
jgi:hypothetical protein